METFSLVLIEFSCLLIWPVFCLSSNFLFYIRKSRYCTKMSGFCSLIIIQFWFGGYTHTNMIPLWHIFCYTKAEFGWISVISGTGRSRKDTEYTAHIAVVFHIYFGYEILMIFILLNITNISFLWHYLLCIQKCPRNICALSTIQWHFFKLVIFHLFSSCQ